MPSIKQILDEVYPMPPEAQYSRQELELWLHKRAKLRKMIEQYKAGELVNFEPMKIGVNLDVLLKLLRN